ASVNYSYNANADQVYFIREIAYDDGTPDPMVGTQAGLGHTNEPGYGWAVKFSPPNEESYLLGAKAYVYMDTVNDGSPNMKFRIYDDSGPEGTPGIDIIPPQAVTLTHSLSFIWWEIDLSDFKDILSNYHGDFFISLQHSDTENNRFGIAVDNTDITECFSYTLYGPAHQYAGWVSFTELSADNGNVSLGDFDLMIRAEMAFLDSEQPVMTGGFLQNPVFTENFDVYLVGKEKLNSSSVSGTITVDGEDTQLDLVSSGSTGKVFVDNDITITGSGTVTMDFSGMNKYGFINRDTTFSFVVHSAEPGQTNIVSSLSGSAILKIGPGALSRKMMLSAVDGFSSPFVLSSDIASPSGNAIPVGGPVTFGPSGSGIGNFNVVFKCPEQLPDGKNLNSLYIARLENNAWIPIQSSVDIENRIVSANSLKLGTFQLWAGEKPDMMIPEEFSLKQNYPNPFNPSTTIDFGLKNAEFVTLKIYNVLGEEIRTLISRPMEAGFHHLTWNGKNDSGMSVGAGVYFYRITAGKFTNVKKMILIK
ncbi:MAG: T9SS type A sorting domain-containing protein, partial [bacterium]|nr:T9SS type A sorting domain-containing protein [bacterium]